MSLDLSTGGKADVVFSFYEGQAGVSSIDAKREATVAVRLKSVRGAYQDDGTVDGQPVELLGIEKSPVAGYTRVLVRFL